MSIIIKGYKRIFYIEPTFYKFLVSSNTGIDYTYSNAEAVYSTLSSTNSNIITKYSIGTPAIATVKITLSTAEETIIETIYVDTTDSETFFNDIKNWVYSKNGPDLILEGNKYKIIQNNTYLILQ